MEKLKVFENKQIRAVWNEEQEDWYFSVVDVVGVLTDSKDYTTGRKYWNKLKQRLAEEGSELVTNCHRLKLRLQTIRTMTDHWQGNRLAFYLLAVSY